MKSHSESLLVIVIQSYLAGVLYGSIQWCLLFQQIPILYLNMSPVCQHNRHSRYVRLYSLCLIALLNKQGLGKSRVIMSYDHCRVPGTRQLSLPEKRTDN